MRDVRRSALWVVVTPTGIFGFAVLVFSINLGRLPFPDELYHVLAARGLLEFGSPRIAEGTYTRGFLQTWLTAWSFRVFGETLATARIPSVVAMASLVTVAFLWLRGQVGNRLAVITASCVTLSPFTIPIAQMCRFYALQSLAVFVGAICVYEALRPSRGTWPRIALGLAALGAISVALHLQPVTVIAIFALCVYVSGHWVLWRLRRSPTSSAGWRWAELAVGVGLVSGAVVLWATGIVEEGWQRYRAVETFNAHDRNAFWYYHAWYQLFFPLLWPMTAILTLAACTRWLRVTVFCAVIFLIAFLGNSFAGAKSLRYISYAQSFLIIIWVLGVAALLPTLRVLGSQMRKALVAVLKNEVAQPEQLVRVCFSAAVAILLLANPAWLRTVTLLADIPVPPEIPSTNWPAARAVLAPVVAKADTVVATEELGTLYFLGRFDLTLNASRYDELVRNVESLVPEAVPTVVQDPRTGRGVGRGSEMMRAVFACSENGVLVSPKPFWDGGVIVEADVKLLVLAHARAIELPRESGLVAFAWDRPSGETSNCQVLAPVARMRDE